MKTYPLLQSQSGVFLECQATSESTQYNNAFCIQLEYGVDLDRLVQAVQKIIHRRAVFRTRFLLDEAGEIRQWSDPEMRISLLRRRCSESSLHSYVENGFVRPFDLLSGEPLARFELVETEVRPYLLMDFHHCISDGTSIERHLLSEDLPRAYEGKELPGPEAGLYEAAEREQASFDTEAYRIVRENVVRRWDGVSFSVIPHDSEEGNNHRRHTETVLLERRGCESWCTAHGTKPYFLIEAAMALVLSRLSRQSRCAFLSLHHGRLEPADRQSFGMFVRDMPVLAELPDELTLTELLRVLREELHEYHRNAVYPFTHFCRDNRLAPGISLNFMDCPDHTGSYERVVLQGRTYPYSLPNGHRDYWSEINLDVRGSADQFKFTVFGSLAMYTPEMLRGFVEAVCHTVQNMIAVDDARLKDLSIVSEEESQRLLALGTGEKLEFDRAGTVVALFRKQVLAHPEATAVVDEAGALTYAELDRRSDILASELLTHGVKPNDFVAVKLPRVKEFVLAVLGIWKAGAAYVPVDPGYPEERIRYMVEDAGAAIQIDGAFLSRIDFTKSAGCVNLALPENLAYMIYTSGSTGKPKGVMISHESLYAFLSWLPAELELKPGDTVAEHASFSFDASICDLYPSIVSGAALHILGDDLRKDLPGLAAYITANHIVGATFSTQLGMELLNACDIRMRYMILGGEKLKPVSTTTTRLYNGYGPTEFTCWSSHHVVDQEKDGEDIPIGRPVPNTISAIVDPAGRLLPRGMTGELVLIGTQMARGYWHRPELTAEKFADAPFLPGQKMYHTGDLARWNDEGELLYGGRIDHQIKLRGFRIELGEIETALTRIPGITNAVAAVKTANGLQRLVAYYVSEAAMDDEALKSELSKTLTEYMVPEVFMRMESMPLTPNGKIDRKALPLPEWKAEAIVSPENEFEEKALEVVIRELGTEQIGVTTNLIAMGLNSIRAIRLAAAVSKATGRTIRTGEILSDPRIRSWGGTAPAEQMTIEASPERQEYPLTANQMGIYLNWEQNPSGLQYNIPMAWRLKGVTAAAVAQALEEVIEAHPYLKTRLSNRAGQVVQLRRDSAVLPVLMEKLEQEPPEAFLQSRVRPFQLLTEDLSRFEVYETPSAVYLFVDVHHLLFDGGSMGVLLSELEKAFHGKALKPERVSAYDYALFCEKWQRSKQHDCAEEYFDDLLAGTEPFLYPAARSNAAPSGILATCRREMPLQPIRDCCRKCGVTENAFFAVALRGLFHRISRSESIQIATVSNGRSAGALEKSIGMFVQTLPLVWRVGKESLSDALKAMQKQIAMTLRHELFPYMTLSEKFHVNPNVMYVYQGGVLSETGAGPLGGEAIPLALDTAKMPLAVNVIPGTDHCTLLLEYDSGLYSSGEMSLLLKALVDFSAALSVLPLEAPLSTAPIVTPEEARQLLALGSGEKIEYDHTGTVVDLFRKQVLAHPEATAVVDKDGALTYAELDRRSDILAAELLTRGVKPNDFVAVKLPRVKEFVLAVIGIWKAGAAYVPVDPGYPEERIQYMVENAGAAIQIDSAFLSGIDFSQPSTTVNLATPERLAYMIYTSGSTGKPKGVMISHESLRAFLAWLPEELALKPGDAVAEHASFSFDASICDLYPSIVRGATLHILGDDLRKDLPGLAAYIAANHIVGASFSTQLGMELLNACDIRMRYMNLGGEKLKPVSMTTTRLYNGYGPTEFTCWSSHHVVDQQKDIADIPIGRPVPNTISAIVDPIGNLLPRGMTGELVLIGTQMARGYWQRPELTAEKFADAPFLPGQKMYHTGDLARWNDEGELLYGGRIDHQIKLRGFRIELGEIEAALTRIPEIQAAVAAVQVVNGNPHLVAYCVSEMALDDEALRSDLSKTLTEYMVPEVFMRIESMPLTPNGKINRKALPLPDLQAIQGSFVEPATATEKVICGVFGDALKMTPYGATTDFFRVGGSSILGIRVVAELQRRRLDVVYGDLFKYKTPRALAAFLTASPEKQTAAANAFDFGDYDYASIHAALQNTRRELFTDFEIHPLGNVLLTGATGYLGIHILNYLLKTTECRIGLLIRPKKGLSPEQRLATQVVYYFDDLFPEEYRQRLIFINGDITDRNLQDKLAVFHYDTVINCAAMVKHYVADDKMDQTNVGGVRNLMECCMANHARLIQLSTYSVGGVIDQSSGQMLDERHLYIGQSSDNDYIRTKFIAERMVLEAAAAGRLRGKVMRIGNLMGRESDGEFQINIASNAFVNSLKTFAIIGAYPLMQMTDSVEMSPIDRVAEAVVRLSGTPDDMMVFQPFNTYHLDMGAILEAIGRIGHPVDYVSREEFADRVEALRNDPGRVKYLQGILHYGGHILTNRKFAQPDNTWTTAVLYRLGFHWKQPDEQYLMKFLQILDRMRVFQQ